MSIVITIYSKSAFKEFVLPAGSNKRLALRIESRKFRIEEDVAVLLENIGGSWRFLSSDEVNQLKLPLCQIDNYDGCDLKEGDSLSLRTRYGERLAVMVREKEKPFIAYKKYDLNNIVKLSVGSSDECDIKYSFLISEREVISSVHAVMEADINDGGWILTDKSTNGTFINDIAIHGSRKLLFGDRINIWGLYMVYAGDVLAIDQTSYTVLSGMLSQIKCKSDEANGFLADQQVRDSFGMSDNYKVVYHRPPRNMDRLFSDEIILKHLPSNAHMIANDSVIPHTRVSKEIKRIRNDYSDYLDVMEEKIASSSEGNRKILNDRYPSAQEACDCRKGLPDNLWSRNTTHKDFLYHRIGKGTIPLQMKIELPESDNVFYDDELDKRCLDIAKKYRMLEDVPVCVDLASENLIGIVGGNGKRGSYQIVYDLIAQITTQNCYTDVKLAFLTANDISGNNDSWSFGLWFPHVWSEDRKRRYIAFEQEEISDVCYDLTSVFREYSKNPEKDHPHYVVIVEDQSLLEGELITKYLFDHENAPFVTTLLMAEDVADLPNACNLVIENDNDFKGMYYIREGKSNGCEIEFDSISPEILYELSGTLSTVVVDNEGGGGEIPDEVSFFDMYGVMAPEDLHIEDRWRRNRTYEGIRGCIGQIAGGRPCILDLHEKYHGPHGLIAGTTGSGKSELLQTWILSLAVEYSPEDIAFFLIDYKGGGMGNAFAKLPHVAGQISNLSGPLVRRAMVAIKSENRRRQRLFIESGVNNIDAYTRLYKNGETKVPLPHLLIIIDEFAQLKAEEPDFMRELISVAQIGRSLGVHLVLATQKPSGTVDDNIWSNSKFRICLRVQDQKDSIEMLHKSDAAFLSNTGRAILQVGSDELYKEFQSGYTGQAYDRDGSNHKITARLLTNTGREGLIGNYLESRRKAALRHEFILGLVKDRGLRSGTAYEDMLYLNFVRLRDEILSQEPELINDGDVLADRIIERSEMENIRLPQRREKSQLETVIEYIIDTAKKLKLHSNTPLWLPELPSQLSLPELDGYKGSTWHNGRWPRVSNNADIKTYAGLIDDPVNQYQMPLIINFSRGGNTAVCGMTLSGRSTFLQTVIYSLYQSYAPSMLNAYILDFGGRMFEVFEDDAHTGGVVYDSDSQRIPNLICMIQDEIARRRKEYVGAGFDAVRSEKGFKDPAIILVIDDMASFREKTEGAYDDALMQIARECASVGIYLLISGSGFGIRDIPGRMSDSIRNIFCLQMADKIGYMDVLRTSQIEITPQGGIAGRGLILSSGHTLEFQTALACSGDELSRSEAIRDVLKMQTGSYDGPKAMAIPFIPDKPTWNLFKESLVNVDAGLLPIGYNITSARIESIDLDMTYLYLISGRPRSGKTNLIRILLRTCLMKAPMEVTVFETSGRKELKSDAENMGFGYVTDVNEAVEWLTNIIPAFKERNAVKTKLKGEGRSDEEILGEIRNTSKPIFVFIDDLVSFAQMMHGPEGATHNLAGAITNLFEKGNLLDIYFFAAYDDEKRIDAAGLSVYESFVSYKNGIHLGGMADAQSILRFDGIPYRKLTAAGKPGSGVTSSYSDKGSVQVVIPLA
ncbi:type VII secretion protein EssC, C-terminal domain-containing protein [Butyrivibrio fibrisolvens DSM 3071]|uniref:Type VII secretion protein EssC, C-terminal domain-containing protein n=1 Tax=Butyrivibrio fibrisolvens DSM 3071 TaxID=1121131 RepID=A0A1M5SRS4_BUTFI|nr:FtsK/SpoIIIE domain-containing protein [Butyrivibrio fibrisolvens]SHH41222.1 type VII secretion protein EssC, C-terminal domain-containing protein [Butyrivibrio fibrisolvens DSM 3071]